MQVKMDAHFLSEFDTGYGSWVDGDTSQIALTGLQAILRRARVTLIYAWRHGRLVDLQNPTRFTELVQLRKLNERSALISDLIDKVKIKDYVAARTGGALCIPTLWHGRVLPDAPLWDFPFIVKSRHGCNQYVVVKNNANWMRAKHISPKWLKQPYGLWLDEQYYADVERGIIIEPFIGDGGKLPVDYKLYVFGGKVAFVQVHLDRATNHRWIIFDRDWKCFSNVPGDGAIAAPSSLSAMIDAAQTLAGDIDFVRVDFYEIEGKPLFGEMTFYPGSGLDPFNPPELDIIMGGLWLEAKDGKTTIS
jgi:TupA-like ATPgrasp